MFNQYKTFYLIMLALVLGMIFAAIHNLYDAHRINKLNNQAKATYHYNIFTGEQE